LPLEMRRLIREMSLANPCGVRPGIHGELLKLGIDIGQTSVAKRMARPAANSFSSDRNNLQKRIHCCWPRWNSRILFLIIHAASRAVSDQSVSYPQALK